MGFLDILFGIISFVGESAGSEAMSRARHQEEKMLELQRQGYDKLRHTYDPEERAKIERKIERISAERKQYSTQYKDARAQRDAFTEGMSKVREDLKEGK